MSNFHFDLSLKLSQEEVHDFSGEAQKFSGEVQNDLRGCTPPHTSPQNPAMTDTDSSRYTHSVVVVAMSRVFLLEGHGVEN
jgi:acyl-CoA synthetase (NDP forming)